MDKEFQSQMHNWKQQNDSAQGNVWLAEALPRVHVISQMLPERVLRLLLLRNARSQFWRQPAGELRQAVHMLPRY